MGQWSYSYRSESLNFGPIRDTPKVHFRRWACEVALLPLAENEHDILHH
jgi:hypothetical protein